MVNGVKADCASTRNYEAERNRRQARKKIFLSAVLFVCFLFVTACGSGAPTTADDPDRIVYVTEYQDVDFANSGTSVSTENEGILYTVVKDETAAEIILHRTDIAAGSKEQVSFLDVDTGEFVAGMAYQQGKLVVLTEKADEAGNCFILYEVTPDGEKLNETDITAAVEAAGGTAVSLMAGDGQENLYIVATTAMDTSVILLVDQAGAVSGKVDIAQTANSIFYVEDALYVYSYGVEIAVLRKDNFDNGTLGATVTLTGIANRNTLSLAAGGATGILVNNGVGIYEFDAATGECSKVLDYLESDFLVGTVASFGIIDQSFWTVNQAYDNSSYAIVTEMACFRPTTAGELPKKEIIRFNAYNILQSEYKTIIDFNKSNPKYRIVVEDFSPADFSEYEAALLRFNSSLVGEESPDLIQVSTGDYHNLIQKGILEDLYPYMEEDDSFNRADYLESALTIYEEDEKLYGIPNSFLIEALVGSTETLEGIERWNVEEMIAFAERHPDAQLFYGDGSSALTQLLSRNLDRFVNWESGESYFEDEDFIRLMEFAGTFKTPDPNGQGDDRQYLLSHQYIWNVETVQTMESMYNGPVTYVGFPTEEGNGIVLSPALGLGMNADSKVKDGVWEFIKFVLSDENQSIETGNFMYSFPVKNSAIENLCVIATENAEAPATEENISQFKDLLGRADTITNGNTQIFNILYEETGSYFAGEKTATEAAGIIQNRVQLYLSENR